MTCSLCRSKALFLVAGEKRQYWRCSRCGLIFVPQKYFIANDEEREHYLKHENSLENTGYVEMFQEKIDILKKVCPGVRTVLDYGCGYAPVLQTLLTRAGYSVAGYDPFFFPETDLSSAFDLIVSTETFEHFKEPGKEIARLVSLLSPKGHLAVMTRFYPEENRLPDLDKFGKWYYKRDPTHISFYCRDTFDWIARTFQLQTLFNNDKDFIVLKKQS